MSLNPTGLIVGYISQDGMAVVIDDPESADVLIFPASFEHREVWPRERLDDYELHESSAWKEREDIRAGLLRLLREYRDSHPQLVPGLEEALAEIDRPRKDS